jgi:hypothetical protein
MVSTESYGNLTGILQGWSFLSLFSPHSSQKLKHNWNSGFLALEVSLMPVLSGKMKIVEPGSIVLSVAERIELKKVFRNIRHPTIW